MTRFRSFAVLALATALLSISAYSQAPQANVKLAMIDTAGFTDEKLGIQKLLNAYKQLQTEFAPRNKELQDGGTKLQALQAELEKMQKDAQGPAAKAVDPATFTSKQEEGQRLLRELEFKEKELNAAFERRSAVVLNPIKNEIGQALNEYAKKNGYTAILDAAKLFDAGALLFMAEAADVTKDFITFFNARPAGAATAAKPVAPPAKP